MNIFLDDIRNPTKSYMNYVQLDYDSKQWQIVRNFLEFKSLIDMNKKIATISFDHDLISSHYQHIKDYSVYDSDNSKTGWHCLKYFLNNYKFNFNEVNVILHSMSGQGIAAMQNAIKADRITFKSLITTPDYYQHFF